MENQNNSENQDIKSQQEGANVAIKSQENVLSGLSDKERLQAAEAENKSVDSAADDSRSAASGTLIGGLSEKERTNAAEADGKIDHLESGLSDKERREAADESW
ncbi:hypothetical protein [Pedobacter sp. SL55]|uniref:hypothetical protein n=1 Tax=Pedobacter sp. SL55 TaxID=2995161 RepID=UPI00226F0E90|nr:hypothetical protein [Pedobacter sp. SL55]WAC42449.1 hypothetical protein OVA16_08870 [Pedobacter sp. SL55]